MADTKKTGSFGGKSNKLGSGGRAKQLKAKGVPGGVIGEIARSKGAAPGQSNFHAAKGTSNVPGKKGPIDPKTLGSMASSLNFNK
jgi:hypothetical protein